MVEAEAPRRLAVLEGNVAVVTGAASGIGRALAERFAREGMKVVLSDVDLEALEALVASLRADGCQAIAVRTDVASLASVEELARSAVETYGSVHVLCNNAGVTKHTGQSVWELTDNDWRWLMGVNFWGVVNGIRTFVPIMLAQGGPAHIVNTASMAGLVVGAGAYGVAKHAVVGLSENLYVDLQRRHAPIGVTCLCPGLVATNIVASERSRPASLANGSGETDDQRAHRERVAAFTSREGKRPEEVADAVVDAIRDGRFYVLTEDPPSVVPADIRIRARVDAILARENPVAYALRKAESRG